MIQYREILELKKSEKKIKRTIKWTLKMKKKILLHKFRKLKKKILKIKCFIKEENGFENTCNRME